MSIKHIEIYLRNYIEIELNVILDVFHSNITRQDQVASADQPPLPPGC